MAIHFVSSFHLLLIACLVGPSLGGVLLSTLPQTLEVQASTEPRAILKAGEDKITVTWRVNPACPETTDETYTRVKLKLCFARISQQDRPWRNAKDDISKDRSCEKEIVGRPYSKDRRLEIFDWAISDDVATGTYFIRAYALDATDKEVAYGQSGDKEVAYGQSGDDSATINLIKVEGISGRQVSLNVLAVCFSIFSVVSLCWFYMIERTNLARRD